MRSDYVLRGAVRRLSPADHWAERHRQRDLRRGWEGWPIRVEQIAARDSLTPPIRPCAGRAAPLRASASSSASATPGA